MFMIHNTLGEDAKIFESDETPTPAGLFSSIQRNPEEGEKESFQTMVRRRFYAIKESNPELVENISALPPRIKVAKKHALPSLLVFIKKGGNFFVRGIIDKEAGISDLNLSDVYERIECDYDEKSLPLSESFWDDYDAVKTHKERYRAKTSEASIEVRARNMLSDLKKGDRKEIAPYLPFLRTLQEDIHEYKTLSDHTLRRIAGWDNLKDSKLLDDIAALQNSLGKDYLAKTKERLNKFDREIIIAIENINE